QERKLARLRSALEPAAGDMTSGSAVDQLATVIESARARFVEAMDDDFNTSGALAALFELVRAINTARDSGVGGEPFTSAQAALRELGDLRGMMLRRRARGGRVGQRAAGRAWLQWRRGCRSADHSWRRWPRIYLRYQPPGDGADLPAAG